MSKLIISVVFPIAFLTLNQSVTHFYGWNIAAHFEDLKCFHAGYLTTSEVQKLVINASLIEAGEAKTQRTSLDLELLFFCNLSKTDRHLCSVVLFLATYCAKTSSDSWVLSILHSMNRSIIRSCISWNTNKQLRCWTVKQNNFKTVSFANYSPASTWLQKILLASPLRLNFGTNIQFFGTPGQTT